MSTSLYMSSYLANALRRLAARSRAAQDCRDDKGCRSSGVERAAHGVYFTHADRVNALILKVLSEM